MLHSIVYKSKSQILLLYGGVVAAAELFLDDLYDIIVIHQMLESYPLGTVFYTGSLPKKRRSESCTANSYITTLFNFKIF
jgi:hypothetical protein